MLCKCQREITPLLYKNTASNHQHFPTHLSSSRLFTLALTIQLQVDGQLFREADWIDLERLVPLASVFWALLHLNSDFV